MKYFHKFITLALWAIVLAGLQMSMSLPRAHAASPAPSAVNVFQNCDTTSAATDYCREAKSAGTANPAISIIKTIINIVSIIGGTAAVIVLVVSGLRIMLANGDSAGVATARDGILYSVVGIIVITLAQTIVIFVLDRVK